MIAPPLPRKIRTRITRAARWSAAGPPGSRPTAITHCHYTREIRTRITHAHCSAARWGHRALPPLHPQYPHAHYPRTLHGRRDGRPPGLPARALPPLPTAVTPAKFARALPTHITRAARWSAAGAPGPRHCPWRRATHTHCALSRDGRFRSIHAIRNPTIFACWVSERGVPWGTRHHLAMQPRQQVAVACMALNTG